MITDDLPPATTALVATSRSVGETSTLEETTTALVTLADALRDAGHACDALATRVVPDDVAGPVCERYRAAATTWPAPSPPSYEQLTAVLSTLHDAGAAARLAARRCDDAMRAVAATAGARDVAR